MSLLNDALRAAEQRQNRPEVAAAYAGQSQSRGRPRSGLWAVVLLFAAGLVGASVFWFMTRTGSEERPVEVIASPAPKTIMAPPIDQDAGTEKSSADSQSVDGGQDTIEPAVSGTRMSRSASCHQLLSPLPWYSLNPMPWKQPRRSCQSQRPNRLDVRLPSLKALSVSPWWQRASLPRRQRHQRRR